MTLDPCQLPTNYTTKLTAVKRFIIQKIDDALGKIYDSTSVSLTVDFGTLLINNITIDGLTNKIKSTFGEVSDSFVNQVRLEAIEAAKDDYLDAEWTTAEFTILAGAIPQFLGIEMTFTGTCPL